MSQKRITRRNCAVTAKKSNKVRYARGVYYSDRVSDELLFLNFSWPSPSLLDFIFNGCHRTGARKSESCVLIGYPGGGGYAYLGPNLPTHKLGAGSLMLDVCSYAPML